MALPLLPLLIGAGILVAAASRPRPSGDPNTKTMTPIKEMQIVWPDSGEDTDDGWLPPGASTGEGHAAGQGSGPRIADMWGGRELSPPGEIIPGTWVDLNELPGSFWADFWFKSDPRGALGLKVKDNEINFLWNVWLPSKEWPEKSGGVYRVKLAALNPLLGPGADWNRVKDALDDIAKAAILGIGGVAAIIGTSGLAPLAATIAGSVVAEQLLGTVIDAVEDIRNPIKQALTAAEVLLKQTYLRPSMYTITLFNRHIRSKDGWIDIGKHYACDPEYRGDLSKPGNCRPLVFVPSQDDIETYFPGWKGIPEKADRPPGGTSTPKSNVGA